MTIIAIQLHRSFPRKVLLAGVWSLIAAACASEGSDLASRRAPAGGQTGDPSDFVGSDPGQVPTPVGTLDPVQAHAVLGIEPPHGPFRGGQFAVIRGNGFSSQVRVWFGDTEVAADQVTATRSDRVQVAVPPGTPGVVAIATQNADDVSTRRSLGDAYSYDAFFAAPEQGPSSGGSIITLIGSGTAWDTDTEVHIDREPCEVLEVRGAVGGPQELDCRTPPGSEGQKSISISHGDSVDTVIGAFSYEPGAVLTGGLSGAPLGAKLTVHVSAPGGSPVPGAYVILGSDFDLASLGQPGGVGTVQQTDSEGTAVFTSDFAGPQLVTVAARCYQPESFVDVPVDTVRVDLRPVISPDCGDELPPSFGGASTPPVIVRGELVWGGGVEFQRGGWTNVPDANNAEERRAAYIFQPSGSAESRFRLPREDRAVTLDSPGGAGYAFEIATGAGSRTFYALAGVENRTVNPVRFTAYAMGILRGLYASPGEVIEGVSIAMSHTLDQALTLDIAGPTAGSRGPDRIDVWIAVQISSGGFAILPNARIESPISGSGQLGLIGLPALVGELEDSKYAVGTRATSGLGGDAPLSVLPLITARDASQPIAVSGFVPVPTLSIGSDNQFTWNRELSVAWSDDGRAVSLVQYEIRSSAGLINWIVAAPPGHAAFRLPDLSRLPEGDLLPGILDVVVSLANVPSLEYAALRTAQLERSAWEAYAADLGSTVYAPAAE